MKKILLLGGSAQQIVAIETAKRLGFNTVLCDYLPDNPGQYHADKFYLVSTTDKDAVLQIAQEEAIHGIVAYASDPAAPTAAYVAERMGLPTNPCESVETLCNKDRFREFLRINGFNTPVARGYSDKNVNQAEFTLPVIVKPVDSSGSKGATVLDSWDGLDAAMDFAFSFSRSHRVIVEEFIEKNHEYLIGGDIFVDDGKVILWGLMNCHRDSAVNPLVPVGKSYPPALDPQDLQNVKRTLQRMVDKLHIRFGAMNVELIVGKNGRVYPIDVGPRNGGNMIPDLLGLIFDVDIVEMTVLAAMGEGISGGILEGKPFYATHNLHSSSDGIYSEIQYAESLNEHIIRKCEYKTAGDIVEVFDNAAKALGIIFLHFDSEEEMKCHLSRINEDIHIVLK